MQFSHVHLTTLARSYAFMRECLKRAFAERECHVGPLSRFSANPDFSWLKSPTRDRYSVGSGIKRPEGTARIARKRSHVGNLCHEKPAMAEKGQKGPNEHVEKRLFLYGTQLLPGLPRQDEKALTRGRDLCKLEPKESTFCTLWRQKLWHVFSFRLRKRRS